MTSTTSRLADLKTALSMSKLSPRDFFFTAAERCNPRATVESVIRETQLFSANKKSYDCPEWIMLYANSILVTRGVRNRGSNGIGDYIGKSVNCG